MTDFEYVLLGYEVDEYCYLLLDKYGEESDVVKVLDSNYEDLMKSSHVFTEKLNAIRHLLFDRGFKTELEYADKIFAAEIEEKLKQKSRYTGLTWLEARQKAVAQQTEK